MRGSYVTRLSDGSVDTSCPRWQASMDDLNPLPVVLLHGLIGSLDDPAIVAALHPHSVFSPSLLGYGANADTDPATITLAKQAEYVAQLVRTKFGSGPVHVVGHSVGCVVAVLLAGKYPEAEYEEQRKSLEDEAAQTIAEMEALTARGVKSTRARI